MHLHPTISVSYSWHRQKRGCLSPLTQRLQGRGCRINPLCAKREQGWCGGYTETLSANGNSYRPVSGDGEVKTIIFYYSVGAAAARKIDAKATYLLQITIAHRLATAITQNWEGLVLKACQDSYVSAQGGVQRNVKLKKDYIPGLGDSADLVMVGGRRDASAVYALGLGNLSWTIFYLA